MKRIALVVIDGQNDFLSPTGALYVKDADNEAVKLAAMIDRLGSKISTLHCTLDSHHLIHVAHPIFWKDEHGNNPSPFTIITPDYIRTGRWACALVGYFDPKNRITYQDKAKAYVEALAKNGRYRLCIWPPHCLIGSPGHNIFSLLLDAYMNWIRLYRREISYVTKGSNIFTEHYSAIQADVPEPTDPSTQINASLLNELYQADEILWAGWAGSHSLANTCRDAVNYFGRGKNEFIRKSVLFMDACAAAGDVPGSTIFHDARHSFVKEMKDRGMRMATTENYG